MEGRLVRQQATLDHSVIGYDDSGCGLSCQLCPDF